MDIRVLALYFVIGGLMVASITYFGSQSKGMLAAFISFLPSISVISIIAIYLAGGSAPAIGYARGMLLLLPCWLLYILAVIFLMPRVGLTGTLAASVAIYLAAAFAIVKFTS